MLDKIKGFVNKHREGISYLFWGGMVTVVSWGSYGIMVFLLDGLEMKVAIANAVSWLAAVIFAFITNKVCVFESKSWKKEVVFMEIAKFLSARILTGAFEVVAVPLLVWIGLDHTIMGIDGMVSKVLVSVIVVILNYIISKVFIFKKKEA
ncbi:MAG: GtrA family protein [Lachnospiraceae bacterium]|nr:GtrA family protein [Lachnospiraceae bacterium]